MQGFDIVRRAEPKETFRVKSVMGTYDLQLNQVQEEFKGEIDMPEKWNVGLIVGRSGSGKTTIAKELFPDAYIENFEYSHESLLDDMPKDKSVSDICKALSKVGFSSPPSWLKSYAVLSNGEKMRCDIARAMLESKDLFVFDEFTSVVDRNVAKIGSFAIQSAIRKENKHFIAVTCHYDVQEWLMPDWVFNTDTMQFSRLDLENQKKNRPAIELAIFETKRKEQYWELFRKYHYLSHNFNKAARVFVAYANGNLAGFCAMLPFPHPTKRNFWRVHRQVVFPDYQGVGIGMRLLDYVSDKFNEEGKGTMITTSSIPMIMGLKHNVKWAATRLSRLGKGSERGLIQNMNKKGSTSMGRITAAFERKK